MSNPRFFHSSAVGNLVAAPSWLFDPAQISTDGNSTGMWRALTPADLYSNISVTGTLFSGITVSNVVLESYALSGIRPVTTSFSIITGSQVTIPVNSRSWAFAVISGEAWVNGSGGIPAGIAINSQNYNASAITIGATGAGAASAKVIVQWES